MNSLNIQVKEGMFLSGKESAKGSKHGDLKEYWHFGQYIEEGRER